MTPISKPPIFCEDCAALALATLDDAPLCAKCLKKMLDQNHEKLTDRIAPLHLDTESWSCEITELDILSSES